MYAFIAQAKHWKAEAKLNHFQISSKYLINFTPKYFTQAAH